MVSLDQFLGLLRSSLLDTKGIEVVLDAQMPTHRLFMCQHEWQHFAVIAFVRKNFHVEHRALSGTSTIKDLYVASLACHQPTVMLIDSRWAQATRTLPSMRNAAYIH